MVQLTKSLQTFLFLYHRDLLVPLTFGHIELYTKEIENEYYEWLRTEEGKKALEVKDEKEN